MNAIALRAVSREEILELEGLMVALALEGREGSAAGNTDSVAPVKHHFAPGLYCREIFLPAGLRIIGKIHRTSHLITVAQGSGIIWNEFGAYEYGAPLTKLTRPGAKNVVWAREDSVIFTYHPTQATTVEEIEAEIISKSYADFDALGHDQKEKLT
jgi:hypothetical protein